MPLCRRHTSDSRNYGDGPPFNRSDSDDESDDSRSYGDDPQHDESDSAEDDPSSEFGRCKYCDAIVLIEEFGKHKAEKCPGVRPDSDFRTSIDTVDQTCQKCEKTFSRKDNFKRHVASKCGSSVDEHSCSECDKSYNRKDNLERHIATIHDRHSKDWKWDDELDKSNIKLRLPANIIVAGATQSGKTTTVAKLLTSHRGYFDPAPRRVILLYNCEQSLYHQMLDTLQNRGVQVKMMKSRDLNENDLKSISSPDFETIVLIDDSTVSVQKSINLAHLFTQARHNHVSFIVFLHSIFGGNDANRIMSQNTLYYFLQNAPRMRGQISNLGSQIGMRKELQCAFDGISATPYSHVFVDLHPKTPINQRIISNILD